MTNAWGFSPLMPAKPKRWIDESVEYAEWLETQIVIIQVNGK